MSDPDSLERARRAILGALASLREQVKRHRVTIRALEATLASEDLLAVYADAQPFLGGTREPAVADQPPPDRIAAEAEAALLTAFPKALRCTRIRTMIHARTGLAVSEAATVAVLTADQRFETTGKGWWRLVLEGATWRPRPAQTC